MTRVLHISPMIPSYNISETLRFWVEVLDFSVVMNSTSYAIVEKDQHTIHLLRAGENIGQMELYLEVDDVDALWQNIQPKLSNIHLKAPFQQLYGMKEIHIAIPFTEALLFIGQSNV